MSATDNGQPSQSALNNATVTIRVFRNNMAPSFTQDVYKRTVEERELGTDLITVRATDSDDAEVHESPYSRDVTNSFELMVMCWFL